MKISDMTAKQGTIPQQAFNGYNILGTPSPKVGDQRGNPAYANVVGRSMQNKYQIAAIAGVLIVGGYLLYHLNFEK